MNYKNNIGYFAKSDNMRSIGLCMLVGGFAALCLGFATSYILFVIGTILLIPGAILYILGAAGRSSDEDIKSCIARGCEGMEVDLSEDRAYNKRIMPKTEPEVLKDFEYREGLMLTRSKSNSLRSSEYTKSILYFLTDGLYIVTRTFSLVEDNVRNAALEIPFLTMDKVEIVRETPTLHFGKKTFNTHSARLVIRNKGDEMLNVPIHDDITADQFAERITRMVEDSKKTQA
jgi:hypothetical protein